VRNGKQATRRLAALGSSFWTVSKTTGGDLLDCLFNANARTTFTAGAERRCREEIEAGMCPTPRCVPPAPDAVHFYYSAAASIRLPPAALRSPLA
jgi:hypothetical protein